MILTHGINSLNREGGGNTINIGGRDYKFVEINGKLWLAENLDYKFTYNGAQIPIGVGTTPGTPAAWYYNNDEEQYGIDGVYKCGLLYNWFAVSYLEQNKNNLLPDGWRVPTNDEWNDLKTFISNDAKKIKALDDSITTNWPSGWNGTNELELNIVPTGYRTSGASFTNVNNEAYVYNCSQLGPGYNPGGGVAYFSTGNSLELYVFTRFEGCAVRLVKDV